MDARHLWNPVYGSKYGFIGFGGLTLALLKTWTRHLSPNCLHERCTEAYQVICSILLQMYMFVQSSLKSLQEWSWHYVSFGRLFHSHRVDLAVKKFSWYYTKPWAFWCTRKLQRLHRPVGHRASSPGSTWLDMWTSVTGMGSIAPPLPCLSLSPFGMMYIPGDPQREPSLSKYRGCDCPFPPLPMPPCTDPSQSVP